MLKDLKMDSPPAPIKLQMNWPNENLPHIQLIQELPLNPKRLEEAIENFTKEVDIKGDVNGFIQQTKERILSATYLRTPGEHFWLAAQGETICGYVLSKIVRDIDNSLCLWVSQAWVDPKWRHHRIVKESWRKITDFARKCQCKYLIIVSGRNSRAYMRWLGNGTHEYATLLKQNL